MKGEPLSYAGQRGNERILLFVSNCTCGAEGNVLLGNSLRNSQQISRRIPQGAGQDVPQRFPQRSLRGIPRRILEHNPRRISRTVPQTVSPIIPLMNPQRNLEPGPSNSVPVIRYQFGTNSASPRFYCVLAAFSSVPVRYQLAQFPVEFGTSSVPYLTRYLTGT